MKPQFTAEEIKAIKEMIRLYRLTKPAIPAKVRRLKAEDLRKQRK